MPGDLSRHILLVVAPHVTPSMRQVGDQYPDIRVEGPNIDPSELKVISAYNRERCS
jgi:hypothetical protein